MKSELEELRKTYKRLNINFVVVSEIVERERNGNTEILSKNPEKVFTLQLGVLNYYLETVEREQG